MKLTSFLDHPNGRVVKCNENFPVKMCGSQRIPASLRYISVAAILCLYGTPAFSTYLLITKTTTVTRTWKYMCKWLSHFSTSSSYSFKRRLIIFAYDGHLAIRQTRVGKKMSRQRPQKYFIWSEGKSPLVTFINLEQLESVSIITHKIVWVLNVKPIFASKSIFAT